MYLQLLSQTSIYYSNCCEDTPQTITTSEIHKKLQMSTIEESISLLDYYCQHKSTKDIAIVFYHTVKKLHHAFTPNSLLAFETKFNDCFARRDLSKLDREIQEAIKHTRGMIDVLKGSSEPLKKTGSLMQSREELTSSLLTPKASLQLEIDSVKEDMYVMKRHESSTFRVSWNQEQNSGMKEVKVQGATSVISHYGRTNPQDEFLEIYNKMMQQYSQHRLDQAYKKSIDASNILRMIKIPNSSTYVNSIKDIESEYQEMVTLYKEFDQPGWVFDNTTNSISLSSKIINKGQSVAVLICAELDIPALNFLVMIQEPDLFKEFVPFCGKGEEIKRINTNLSVARSVVDIPFLTNRETYFLAKGLNRLSTTGSLFFYSKSINDSPEIQTKLGVSIPEKTSYIRLDYNFFIVECRPLTQNRVSIRMASSVDMKLNFIPNFILMVSARKFALTYFQNILKEQKHFGQSKWSQRLKEKHEIYGFYQRLIVDYLSTR